MKLSILVPFRDADGTRTPAKEWIVKRWAHHYPEAEIIEASDDGIDPFNKSMAVNNAAKQATGDIYIVLDADTWADTRWVQAGIDIVATKQAHWDIPCRKALRLKQDVSERIMQLDPTIPELPPLSSRDAETHAAVVGFLWIISRKAYENIGPYADGGYGMDERIRGWGGEDTMFTWAMRVLNGHPRRGVGTLMSLWHPRPRDSNRERVWVGQGERRLTEQAKRELASRYSQARNPARMREVLRTP